VISKTIGRQVLGLETSIAYYNHHRSIFYPKDNLLQVTMGDLLYIGNLDQLEYCYNQEENYWKWFIEKLQEENTHSEKNILFVENLLSDVPSAVKDFVEKNDTTGGGSFQRVLAMLDDEEESESVEQISPSPPKTTNNTIVHQTCAAIVQNDLTTVARIC
jgi:hypothetical protein